MKYQESDKEIVETYLKEHAFSMLKPGGKVFRNAFIDPGAGYHGNLWDWDSYFTSLALIELCEYFKNDPAFSYEKRRQEVLTHAAGCVKNFLNEQLPDGFIPMIVMEEGTFRSYLVDEHKAGKPVNQHKPFLAANTLQICGALGDFNWFDCEKLENYLLYYQKDQYNTNTGLYFWRNDVMIGIDNNPTVFGRPEGSCADVYLNSFLYSEFRAMAEIFKVFGEAERVRYWENAAESLKQAVNRFLYDERDEFFYSADLCVKHTETEIFHHGMAPFWKALPMKIRFWGGFLPVYTDMVSKDCAYCLLKRNLDDDFLSEFGVRSLAKNEKMYNQESTSNPSNWLGPIWIVVQYCVWACLKKAGMEIEAANLAQKTLGLLALDIRRNGHMSESYRADDGSPMMHGGFLNWNCLILKMIRDEQSI